MTQKVNSKQLKEIYFNPPSSKRLFHENSRYSKMRKSNHSFLESEKHFQKYSEEEISKFEDFFNKYYYHPNSEGNIPISNKQSNMGFLDVFEPLVTDKHLEKDLDANFELNTNTFTSHDDAQLTLDNAVVPKVDSDEVVQISLLERDLLEQSSANLKKVTKDFNLEEPVSVTMDELLVDDGHDLGDIHQDEQVDFALDDDLIYLENLVSNGGNGIATTPLGSIGNLLDEIVDNEKNQISNYENNIFNANIQSLLNVDPEADLPSVPQPPKATQSVATPPIPPRIPVISNNEEVDDEAIETNIDFNKSLKHIKPNDDPVCEDLKVENSLLNAITEPYNNSEHLDNEKEANDDFNDFIDDKEPKSKNKKFSIIDIILVILLIIVFGLLIYQFRFLFA